MSTVVRVGIDARHAARGLGIATFLQELTRELARRDGFELCWLGSPRHAPEGVEPHDVRGPYPRLDLIDAERTVRRHGLDVMLFGGNTGPVRELSVPIVLTVHDLLFFGEPRPRRLRPLVGHMYSRWGVPRAIRTASAVATVSEVSADEIRELVPGTDVAVVPHGVTAVPAADVAPIVCGAVVAFVARDPRKRSELVVEAYRALAAPRPPLVLFAGAGVPAELEAAIEELRGAGEVHVVPHVPREVVDATIRAALALVYPSEREGFGLPVLEGMTLGAPVITGLAPAVREVASNAALTIDPENPAASIAAHLKTLRDDPGAADVWRSRGRARAAHFSWSAAADRYEDLLRTVVLRRTGRS